MSGVRVHSYVSVLVIYVVFYTWKLFRIYNDWLNAFCVLVLGNAKY
jgi:hypothetical protein